MDNTGNKRTADDLKKEAALVRDVMAPPGMRVIVNRLGMASRRLLLQYDKATPEQVQNIKVSRWFLNEELPRMIDSIISEEARPEKRKWSFKRFFGIPD